MNRLIILGNGFDLAHGLKTSYTEFLEFYFNNAFQESPYTDNNIHIPNNTNFPAVNLKDIKQLTNDNILKIRNKFLKKILNNYSITNWVDFENIYYKELKNACEKHFDIDHLITNYIKPLNDQFGNLKEALEKYLYKNVSPAIKQLKPHNEFLKIFEHQKYDKICYLNFNYTDTIKNYTGANGSQEGTVINIHGSIMDETNPIVFGFGDELDDYYQVLENLNNNEIFRYIKSFMYFQTSNYHNLLNFIESEEFQISIIGHSCGLSDRTLLNYIFESDNCKYIRIYYHNDKYNFVTHTYEISRHFKDKAMMRKKIVPFANSQKCPQIEY